MSYYKHPELNEPNDDQLLWRYIDFSKFLNLLESERLFLTRADKFEDTYEGYYPKDKSDNSLYLEKLRQVAYISCWHMNECESAAMWDLYAKRENGIALATTFKSLKTALAKSGDIEVCGGIVSYEKLSEINYSELKMQNKYFAEKIFITKRTSFEHEREFRLLLIDEAEVRSMEADWRNYENGHWVYGREHEIDLGRLIKKVYISPFAKSYFVETVIKVLNKYEDKVPGLSKMIVKSDLYNLK